MLKLDEQWLTHHAPSVVENLLKHLARCVQTARRLLRRQTSDTDQ